MTNSRSPVPAKPASAVQGPSPQIERTAVDVDVTDVGKVVLLMPLVVDRLSAVPSIGVLATPSMVKVLLLFLLDRC
jgi:hypothetical protein